MTSTASGGLTDAPTSTSTTDALGRRDALRKLAVGGAIVWAAPVITSSVPAAAATSVVTGPCTNFKVDWDLQGNQGDPFSSAVINPPNLTMTLTSSFSGGTVARSTNKTIRDPLQGGVNEKALRFEQTPVSGGGQTIRMTWNKQVRNVTFSFFDIDNSTSSGWSDRIVINTTPFTYETTDVFPGSTVNGAGTSDDPFKNTQTNNNLPNTSDQGNLQVTWAGPLFFVEFQFKCAAAASGGTNQLINISDVSFCR